MPECPYCGRWFKTKAGLKQHIAKSHEIHIRFLDPTTVDPLGAVKRRAKRKKRRKKEFDFWL